MPEPSVQASSPWPWLPPDWVVQQASQILGTPLTAREIDVVACLSAGRTAKKIAQLLALSHKTVHNYIHQVSLKLDVHSKDGIIDAIEQAGAQILFKVHYLHVQTQPLFKHLLADIMSQEITVLFIEPDDPSLATLMHSMIQPLKQAGCTITMCTPSECNRLQTSAHTHVVSGYRHKLPSIQPRASHIQLSLTPNDGPACDNIVVLAAYPDFYGVMLALLQIWYPRYPLDDFQQAYQHIMGSNTLQIATQVNHEHRSNIATSWWVWGIVMLLMLAVWYRSGSLPATDRSTTWNLPPIMSYYTERPELTQHIWQQLQRDPGKGTVSLVGLRGMGGVGKTTLALEAIHDPKRHYHLRAWFKAETSELLQTDYLDLGEQMNLFTQRMNARQKIMAVKAWLQNQPSALLVYDNAPDMKTVQPYLPNQGHIIITSRNQHMPHPIDIEGMQEREAVELLDKLIPDRLKQHHDPSHLKTLAQELGYLPLALAQAGAYITQHQITIEAYLKRYQSLQAQLLAQHTLPPQDLHEPIYVTWDMNIQAIQQHPQGKQALQLMDAIAYLYPENIPKALLAQYLFQLTDEEAITQLDTLIGLLKTYSLIQSSGNDISIHRLVHAYLRYRHQSSETLDFLKKIIHSMLALNRMDTWGFQLLKSMIPHIEHLKSHGKQWLTERQLLQLNTILGWLYYLSGRLTTAKDLCQQILPTSIQLYGEFHPQTAEIYRSLGSINLDLVRPIEGKVWLEKALLIFQKHFDKQHVSIGWVYRDLGSVYRELRRPIEGKIWVEKALPIFQKYFGEHHIWTASVYQDLGAINLDLGHPIEGQFWLEKALPIFQKHFGDHHVWTAWVYRSLGYMHLDLKQPLEAKNWFEKALLIFQKHFGDHHVWVARVHQGLGWVELDIEHPQEAEKWFKKALLIYESRYDQDYFSVARLYDGLGWSKLKLGLPNQALSWFSKSLTIHQKYSNEHHVSTLPTHHGLAWVYFKMDQLDISKSHLEQAQQIIRQHQKKGHQFNQKLLRSLTQLSQALATP